MEQKPKIRAFLSIRGFSGKPESITEILGIKPDETWIEGDIIPAMPLKSPFVFKGPNQRYKYSNWTMKSTLAEDASYDVEDYIKDIMGKISPIKEKFQQLPAGINLMLCVWIDIFPNASMPGIGLEVDTMKFLTSINAEVDIDISMHAEGFGQQRCPASQGAA